MTGVSVTASAGRLRRPSASRHGRVRHCVALSILIAEALYTGITVPASAAPKAKVTIDKDALHKAEVLAAQAKQAFKDKHFEEAAKLFMQAYGLTHEPAMVFNAARAYEEAGKTGDAASLFRLYGTIASDPDGIAEARLRLKKLEGRGGDSTAAPAGPQPAKPAETAPGAVDTRAPAANPATQPPNTPASTVTRTAVPSGPDRTWAWISTGGAVVLLGGGATLLWLGRQASHDANALPVHSLADIDKYNADFDQAATLSNAGAATVGVGVVAAGVATWLHLRAGVPVTAGIDTRGGVWLAGRW